MSQQTSYEINGDKGVVGTIADISPRDVETKINEETTAGAMAFGLGVIHGTTDNQVLLPVDANSVVIGFVAYTTGYEMAAGGSEISIAENDPVSVLRDGPIYVIPEDDVTQGANVFVRHTPNTTETVGAVRSDIDTDKAIELTDWEFAESGTGGTLVKIRKR
jgi:hypothetical protein